MERNSRSKTSRKMEYILWEDIAYSPFYLEHKIHILLLFFSCQVMTNSLQLHGLQQLPVLHCLLELAQIHVPWVGDAIYLVLYHPLLLLPSIFPSIRGFSSESALCIMWPNYWSFSISTSNEYSGLISFRIDWFDLLAVQGTLNSLLQCHSSKTSILQHAVFFMVKLSHLCMTTGKTIALTM